jgi:hypothetical protein
MEHREAPRTAVSEGPNRDATGPGAGRRFARFVPTPNVRRIARSRVGIAALVSALILGLALLASNRLIQVMTTWLHARAEYRIDPDAITFDEELPSWYVGGKRAFLQKAGIVSAAGEPGSALDIDLERLTNDLKHNCWVKRVDRIQRSHPNRLRIEWELRKPVAVAMRSGTIEIVIDDEAVLLPKDEIDLERAGPLIQLVDNGNLPDDRTPGTPWKKDDAGTGLAKADEAIVDAARLAAFLKRSQAASSELRPEQRFRSVFPKNRDRSGLFARTDEGLWVFWGDAPTVEEPGELSAETKWKRVCDWMKANTGQKLGKEDYLTFTKTGVVYHQRSAAPN